MAGPVDSILFWFLVTLFLRPCLSVMYVPDGPFGSFLTGKGRALTANDSYHAMPVSSVCDCRMACFVNVACKAASAEPSGSELLCRLSKKGPFDSDVVENAEATYMFWSENLVFHGVLDDNLVYVEAIANMDFVHAERQCWKIPGHRLPVFKKREQKQVIDKLLAYKPSRAFWTDLRKDVDIFVYSDGTHFKDTEISSLLNMKLGSLTSAVFSWYSSLLEKPSTGFNERVVCQGNPLGIEW